MALNFNYPLSAIMIDYLLPYFTFSYIEIIALSLFFLFFLIQLFYYFNYYKKPYSYIKKKDKGNENIGVQKCPKVSVVIASENEGHVLSKNLPLILEQNYPDFEVIVVNNGSTDETDYILNTLTLNNPHLYYTYLPSSEDDESFNRRKLALTIGIKAAKGDVLLFTEPYSKPISKNWISAMVEGISEEKEVVLGYSSFSKTKKLFNRLARFDNHFFSMQYLSMAIKKKGFIGTYRNMAFKKHIFFDNKGFASCLNIENGEDVFVNQIITKNNTTIALSQDSFIETSLDNFSLWKEIKKSYSIAKSYFRGGALTLFSFEMFTRYLFYIGFISLIIYSLIFKQWAILGISVFLFLFRLITQLIIVNKSAKYFHSGKFYFSLPLLDILLPIYNLQFKTKNRGNLRGRR